MNRAQIEHFWLLHQSGELSAAEAAALAQELSQNRLQRQLLLGDGETHRTLDALAFNEHTVDTFTSDVLTRWEKERKPGKPSPSRNGHATGGNARADHLLDEDDPQPKAKKKNQQYWHKWAIAAAVLFFLSVVGFALIHRPEGSRNDNTNAQNKHVREEPPEDEAPRAPQRILPARDGQKPRVVAENPRILKQNPDRPDLMRDNKDNPPGNMKERENKPQGPRIARLTEAEACHWKGIVPDEWLGTDVLNLLRGKATITFNEGAVVEMTGPSLFELNSVKEGLLRQGTVRATIPAKAAGFHILTPVGTAVGTDNTFALKVDQDGSTEVTAEKGSVEFEELGMGNKAGSRIMLKQGETKRFAAKQLPSPRGGNRFQGKININGKEVDFNNPEEMQKELEKMRKKMLEDFERMQQQFPFGPMPGQQLPPFFGPIPPQMPPFFGPNRLGPQQGFRATLIIDGKVVEFTDPWEYQRALRKQMLDSLRPKR